MSEVPERIPSLESECADRLTRLQIEGLYRPRTTWQRLSAVTYRRGGREVTSFGLNDYLSLATDPGVCRAAADAASAAAGSSASPLIAGRTPHHARLEQLLAEWHHAESALLFPSGYAANLGVLTSLTRPSDLICCDRDNHASLIDGCRAAEGRFVVYRRENPERLDNIIARRLQPGGRVWLVTDSVYSMDGCQAPLEALQSIAARWNAVLVVDEAHATGVVGATGAGLLEEQGNSLNNVIRVGTLSKALGSQGGFVTGSESVIDVLRHAGRSQFFSTALSPANCAAAVCSIRMIQKDCPHRERLRQRVAEARRFLAEAELASVDGSEGPVIPILTGTSEAAVGVAKELLDEGWHVPAIRPPTVRSGTARLRLSINAAHEPGQIEEVIRRIADSPNVLRASAG